MNNSFETLVKVSERTINVRKETKTIKVSRGENGLANISAGTVVPCLILSIDKANTDFLTCTVLLDNNLKATLRIYLTNGNEISKDIINTVATLTNEIQATVCISNFESNGVDIEYRYLVFYI